MKNNEFMELSSDDDLLGINQLLDSQPSMSGKSDSPTVENNARV